MIPLEVIVGGKRLRAHLDDTAAARDFLSLLPLELTFRDFNAVERIADLPRRLDTGGVAARHAPSPGDITYYVPWGNLAIFHEPYEASSGLMRLGAFDEPIDALLDAGGVPVRIEAAR